MRTVKAERTETSERKENKNKSRRSGGEWGERLEVLFKAESYLLSCCGWWDGEVRRVKGSRGGLGGRVGWVRRGSRSGSKQGWRVVQERGGRME